MARPEASFGIGFNLSRRIARERPVAMLWFLKTLSAAKTLLGSSPLLPRYQQTVRVQLTPIVASHRTALKTPGVIPIRLKSVVSTDEQGRIVARPEASFGIGRNLPIARERP